MLTDYQRYRLYEIAPGISIWATLLGGVALSFIDPLLMIYLIIIFDVYWVLRVLYFSFYVVLSWNRFRKSIKRDWFQKLVATFPDWEKRINVVFLPLYNEEWSVIRTTLEALRLSSYPAAKLYVVFSGES